MAGNGDFAEDGADGGGSGAGRVRERAEIGRNVGKAGADIGVPECDEDGSGIGGGEDASEKLLWAGIETSGAGCLALNDASGAGEGFGEDEDARGVGDGVKNLRSERIDVVGIGKETCGVGRALVERLQELLAPFGEAGVVGEDNRYRGDGSCLGSSCKRELMGSVANKSDGAVGDLLREIETVGLSDEFRHLIERDEAFAVETQRCLEAEDFEHAPVDALTGYQARLDGVEQAVVGTVEVGGDDDHVVAGENGLDGFGGGDLSLVAGKDLGERAHVERVGDHEAVEAKLLLEQVGDDAVRDAGRTVRVGFDGGNGEVTDHDRVHPGGNCGAEGREFERVKPVERSIDAGESEVGVGVGIAVAGEVFGGGEQARGVSARDVGRDHGADQGWISTEGAGVDDWIGGVGVDVGDGKPVPVDADGAGFEGGDAPELAGKLRVASRAEGHGCGEGRCAVQAHGQPALEVSSEEQRIF
uniref:Uncharacterized protein n=1 Tax=mine drainage metagenome TaxID=410659 RepID=E6QLE1_9ZZZZ